MATGIERALNYVVAVERVALTSRNSESGRSPPIFGPPLRIDLRRVIWV